MGKQIGVETVLNTLSFFTELCLLREASSGDCLKK